MVTPFANKTAKKFAKRVLKNDFSKLLKDKYLSFNILVKHGKKIRKKRMLFTKSAQIYTLAEGRTDYRKLCSLIVDRDSWNYESNIYPLEYYVNNISVYDKVIAFYLWFKFFSKHPISRIQYNNSFNLIDFSFYTIQNIKEEEKYP